MKLNHTLKLLPLAIGAAMLSACHQGGVGVDSGASQKASTSAEQGLKSDRSIQQRSAASAAVQMPAAAFIINTLSDWGESELATAPNARAHFWNLFCSLPLSKVSLQDQAKMFQSMGASMQQTAIEMSKKHPDKAASLAAIAHLGETPHPTHQAAAQFIAMSATPLQGWPVGGLGAKGQAEMAKWGRWSAQNIAFSNLVLSQIAATPALRDALADPAAAKKAIIAAFLSIPASQLEAAWAQAAQAAQGDLSLDMTGSGPAPIHFTIGANDFQCGPIGWKWSQSGVPWFGEGRINGKTVMLGLDSAIDKSTAQTSTTGTTSGTSTDQSAGGAAGVK
ncbi:MAG: hypothetical protein RBR52_11650 [Thiomonas sp.]|uniref:hypothetical protein n=1 Tax=Thiomonas sp. TaxID=2047785 RepID=UPI002A36B04A|nr:hypothetical protein [Thiomonas sp.]MDY0331132.1 hypothetical protein [Thiomonas sp.]